MHQSWGGGGGGGDFLSLCHKSAWLKLLSILKGRITLHAPQWATVTVTSKRETTTHDTPQKGKKAMWGHGVNMAVYRWGTRCGNWLPEERQSRWPGWHPHWTNQTFWTDCSKVAPLVVQQLCNPLPATQNMAQGSGYRHPETWERSTWSKKLQTNLPLVSPLQALWETDPEQAWPNYWGAPNSRASWLQTWKILYWPST